MFPQYHHYEKDQYKYKYIGENSKHKLAKEIITTFSTSK